MPFSFKHLEIPEVILVESMAFEDHRGFFMEAYKHTEFKINGIPALFIQDNFSHSVHAVLRGLHFQNYPKAQAKLVIPIRGEIFDVAVDLRKDSPTYKRWVGIKLSDKKHQLLYIPEGFAHGYCVLSVEADIFYKSTEEYAPELERGIIWNDPELGINWPFDNPILSAKDAELPSLRNSENVF